MRIWSLSFIAFLAAGHPAAGQDVAAGETSHSLVSSAAKMKCATMALAGSKNPDETMNL